MTSGNKTSATFATDPNSDKKKCYFKRCNRSETRPSGCRITIHATASAMTNNRLHTLAECSQCPSLWGENKIKISISFDLKQMFSQREEGVSNYSLSFQNIVKFSFIFLLLLFPFGWAKCLLKCFFPLFSQNVEAGMSFHLNKVSISV